MQSEPLIWEDLQTVNPFFISKSFDDFFDVFNEIETKRKRTRKKAIKASISIVHCSSQSIVVLCIDYLLFTIYCNSLTITVLLLTVILVISCVFFAKIENSKRIRIIPGGKDEIIAPGLYMKWRKCESTKLKIRLQ